MGIPIKTDYDIFFPNEEEFQKARSYFWSKKSTLKWESDNGIKLVYQGKTYDLVKKYFQGPQETINEFDFTASMIAIDGEKVYHGETTFIDLAKKQLMINKITYPPSTLSRAFRYHKKGFSICLGEIKKIIESIQNMPPINEEIEENNNENIPSGDVMNLFLGID